MVKMHLFREHNLRRIILSYDDVHRIPLIDSPNVNKGVKNLTDFF